MFPRPRICRFAEAFVLMAVVAAAQTNIANWDSVKALPPDTNVRITAGSRVVNGKIQRITDDMVVVASGSGQEMFNRQEVSLVSSKKPGHRKRNALIGLAAGAGAGLVVGLAARHGPGGFGPNLDDAVTAGMTVAGGLVGSLVGVFIPTGGWHEIYKK
jgi:hypothetical protein